MAILTILKMAIRIKKLTKLIQNIFLLIKMEVIIMADDVNKLLVLCV
ncbi:MAG: hypothetical protein MSA34_01310 [Firmicutes bacterium]|nr:hypothetical protein [Bacillota bacterium]MDY5586202.1 hypothetical protein [Eubacteriales bacterium]